MRLKLGSFFSFETSKLPTSPSRRCSCVSLSQQQSHPDGKLTRVSSDKSKPRTCSCALGQAHETCARVEALGAKSPHVPRPAAGLVTNNSPNNPPLALWEPHQIILSHLLAGNSEQIPEFRTRFSIYSQRRPRSTGFGAIAQIAQACEPLA